MEAAENLTAGMTDKPYGRVTVLPHGAFRKGAAVYVLCRCECGTEWAADRASVRRGKTKSCGCLKRDKARDRRTTHGYSSGRHPLYSVWLSMNDRCNNPNADSYPDYGGRGILVCDRWRGPDGFPNFLADMGEKPGTGYSIDRFPDTNGNYEPSNCRWATDKQQANNKRNNRLLTHDGRTQTLTAWAEETGIAVVTIHSRIGHLGWSVAQALTTPSRGYGRKKCKS